MAKLCPVPNRTYGGVCESTCVVIIVVLPGLHLSLPAPATLFGSWSSVFVLDISHAVLGMTQHGVLLSTQLLTLEHTRLKATAAQSQRRRTLRVKVLLHLLHTKAVGTKLGSW